MNDTPEVTILCTTFNQASYIKDALDSFFMQQTDFPFEVIVHDDASTDGTREILESYEKMHANLTVLYEESNQFSNLPIGGYFQGLMEPMAKGKYIALCEGDDYWIDEHKLQHQYDYMESHPECLCCGHSVLAVDSETGNSVKVIGYGDRACDVTSAMVLKEIRMQTASLFYRNGLGRRFISQWNISNMVIGDIPWLVWLCENGSVRFDPTVSSVYRLASKGSFSLEVDKDKLSKRYKKLIELFETLNVLTDHKYNDTILDREADYAFRGAVVSGMKFIEKDGPGHKVKPRIGIKKLIYLHALSIYHTLTGMHAGS